MSRVNPIDVGMPAGSRAALRGSAVGSGDLSAGLPRTEHECPVCGSPMTGHGSNAETMAHAVGHAPCRLEVTVPRSRCKRCGTTVSEEVGFASALSPGITEALGRRIVELLRQRATVKEAAALCGEHCGTVRLVIDGVRAGKPKLPRTLLMDEARAYSRREPETGKQVAVYRACARDGDDGKLVDMVEGRDSAALDQWRSRFGAEERNRVKAFRGDMYDPFPSAAAKWLPLAVRAADRFHAGLDGVAHMDEARRRIQKGAGNGAPVKRRARKPAADRGKRSREHPGEAWAGHEKRVTCEVLCVCDEKHSHLRQARLVLQLRYEWQDADWDGRREECDEALRHRVMKATGLCVPEIAAFGQTVADRRQQLVTGTAGHINSARAESANDKIKELKKRGRGFGGFAETRKRLPMAFGKPDAVELPTARARRKAQAEARRAEARERAAAKARKRRRKRRR